MVTLLDFRARLIFEAGGVCLITPPMIAPFGPALLPPLIARGAEARLLVAREPGRELTSANTEPAPRAIISRPTKTVLLISAAGLLCAHAFRPNLASYSF